jgi:carbon starvation protein CstA
MLTLLGGIALLVLGYFTYGRYIEKNFAIETDRPTPAETLRDDPFRWQNGKMLLYSY